MSSQIGLAHLFYCPYYRNAALQDFYFVFFYQGPYKQAISFSSWQLHNSLV